MTSPPPGAPSAPPRPARAENPNWVSEIDGLRGIALTLVVVFHLFGQGRVSGGVDVFLFVSGFLLTASLARAAARGERIGPARRYGRMLLRLTPAALLVLVATGGIVLLVLPEHTWIQNGTELVASALFLENQELIRSQLAYGAAGPGTSPFQHFWSLSIQGQYFLLWPLAVALVALLVRPRSARRALALVTGALALASLAWAVWLNGRDADVAYFDSAARFWEFAAGGLLAIAYRRRPALRDGLRVVLGWTGLALVLASGILIDGAASYPGLPALVPIGGAALVILASGGPTRLGADRVLELRPVRFVARISYPLYLWHWPILIAYLAVRERDAVGPVGAAGVLLLAVLLAVATQRLLVEPILARRAVLGPRRSLLLPVGAATVVVLTASLGVGAQAAERDRAIAAAEALASGRAACLGAASLDPELDPCVNPDLEDVLVPAIAGLPADDDNRIDCWARDDTAELKICTVGADEPGRRLLAIGDSHNNTLLGVYERIAETYGWSIDVAGHSGCYLTTAPQRKASEKAAENCAGWVDAATAHIAATEYDAIIVTQSRRARLDDAVPEDQIGEVRVDGMVEAWSHRLDPATPVIAIEDNPIFARQVIACVEEHGLGADRECALPRAEALPDAGIADAADDDPNAHVIDLTDYMCGPDTCSPVVGNVILTRDGRHLTATFAHTLTPYLGPRLREIVEG
ncbi:acyltransferase [Agromyces rhizosphaerae]|uniref:Acyltransferase n=1 Tax=Agromyces rhizosphaerae TaxID=88374 RepID=A0A9W6CNZ9_9MICO|nr:acyltransferase family protein [Agromyces rhizosphaerae]GLI26111.1 acyltransferase [Agromyces rhizosphaerae]